LRFCSLLVVAFVGCGGGTNSASLTGNEGGSAGAEAGGADGSGTYASGGSGGVSDSSPSPPTAPMDSAGAGGTQTTFPATNAGGGGNEPSASGGSNSGPSVSCGSDTCTSRWWPRIIVTNQSGQLVSSDWHVYVVDAQGVTTAAATNSCPVYTGSPNLGCDFGFFAGTGEFSYDLHLDIAGVAMQQHVVLHDRSLACTNAMVRVRVIHNADGSVALSEPESLNPCAAM
jgi:hypothetical protein